MTSNTPEIPAAAGMEEATFAEIRDWALRNDLAYTGGNLGVVNKLRRAQGLRHFILVRSKAERATC